MPLPRSRLLALLERAVAPLLDPVQTAAALPLIELDIPKAAQHGDYATTAALTLARVLRRQPRDIAAAIVAHLDDTDQLVQRTEIAGPGFINFFLRPSAFHEVVGEILNQADDYGRHQFARGRRVQVEFVSANPTGPLHIGHGRGAVTGDVLARCLDACGHEVSREYYINDAGNQMDTLGRSLYYRYLQVLGETVPFPDNHYQGDYLVDLAREFAHVHGDRYRRSDPGEVLATFTEFAGSRILDGIRADLDDFGVRFDTWFSERSLHDDDCVQRTLAALEARGHIYERDGARWFKSTAFGDEKDRVVVRATGASTYFAADLAYHKNKFDRHFERVIDVWGADHHGYVARMLAGVQALGRADDDLQIVLVQLVNLLRGGKPVAMTTRGGEFVTLREVIAEVGRDAARFLFLTRRSDSPLDFDLETAKMQSNDNPVYYVQYAHARLCSVFEVAAERGIHSAGMPHVGLEKLDSPQEIELLRLLGEYPTIIANSARFLEPHRIPYYLTELVAAFHSYYNQHRIIGEDAALTQARLRLAAAIRIVLRNGLGLLGVSAPERM
jgi:arginyl-tRNA synthetase